MFMFWLNDYSDSYAGYRYIVGASQNLGIFFNSAGSYINGIGDSHYYNTCINKNLTELVNLKWTFYLENSDFKTQIANIKE